MGLKDHQINVIIGYYLTKHSNDQILLFIESLQECDRNLPFSASILVAKQFLMWINYRDNAADIIGNELNAVRNDLVKQIGKVTVYGRN